MKVGPIEHMARTVVPKLVGCNPPASETLAYAAFLREDSDVIP